MNFRAGRARQVVPPLGQQKRTFFSRWSIRGKRIGQPRVNANRKASTAFQSRWYVKARSIDRVRANNWPLHTASSTCQRKYFETVMRFVKDPTQTAQCFVSSDSFSSRRPANNFTYSPESERLCWLTSRGPSDRTEGLILTPDIPSG